MNKDIKSRAAIKNSQVNRGIATAVGYEFNIAFAFMDLVIECLDFKLVKKVDLENKVKALIHYEELD